MRGGTILRGGFASLLWNLERRFGGAFWLSWLLAHRIQAWVAPLWVELSFCARTLWMLGGAEPHRDGALRGHERSAHWTRFHLRRYSV